MTTQRRSSTWILGVCVLTALSAAPRAAAAQDDEVRREFDVRSGNRLELDLRSGGTITVAGWDREVVAVDAYRSGADCADVRIDFAQDAAGVRVESYTERRSRDTHCDLRLDIRVPRRFDIEFETMGGDVALSGVEGDLRGSTMGGALELTRLRGALDLTTMGGNITLTDSEVDGKVHTMGGEVRIEDVVGDVKGTSMGGNVRYSRVTGRPGPAGTAAKSNGDEVRIHTMGGQIHVDAAPAGADVETMGGDISIRSASDHVKARTMGGRIEIGAVDGWIEATTMGGDVTARMTGDPAVGDRHVSLTSMGGDVTLIVPAGLSMQVDITLAYTRDSDRDYRIISDFPLGQEETEEWEYEHGTPRKYIYGTGNIAGGRHRIRIETVNGNVYLRRAP
ncbi:MAG TPA: hypothetical protein VF188_07035 [Longimicrobiales bacterium]